MDLFETVTASPAAHTPLAVRMRPRTLDEFVGQQHLLGDGQLLRRCLEANRLTSLILYGPPGVGKTTLAHLIANTTRAQMEQINAVTAGVAELRQAIAHAAQRQKLHGQRTLLFIDEIHRFNKAQQDVLMPHIEAGNPILIGATTFNPFFALLSPLLSRSIVCELKPLTATDLRTMLQRAIADQERGLGQLPLTIDDAALTHWTTVADGDGRRALNALEVAALTTPKGKSGRIHITLPVAEQSIQKKAVVYDKDADGHYDTASAFIKAMRGSDPDAALYWLAKMLYAGEEPRFIARRLVICAAEDVGNADPQALVVAAAAMQAAEFVGLPECRIPLAQAVVYVACAPKSNAAYLGIEQAMQDVEAGKTLEVPTHLKDTHYRGAKQLGHGAGYKYAHNFPGHHVEQDYLPEARRYYEPAGLGFEQVIKERLAAWRAKRQPRPPQLSSPASKAKAS